MKCKVCGARFALSKDTLYQVEQVVSVTQMLTASAQIYDAVDCPKCGCQLTLGVRLPRIVKGGAENDY